MKRNRRVLIAAIAAAGILCSGLPSSAQAERAANSARPTRIVVPVVNAAHVVTDGTFSAGEWDGAFRQPLGDNFEVYLLADSAYLYVGFKYLKDVEAAALSEVYVATSDKQFVNLHSSGSLGEGMNDFPPQGGRPNFSVGNATGWESNATPREARLQGKEFKISRARLPGTTVRLAGSMGVVNRTMRESASFPKDLGFSSPDGWVELILPASKSAAVRTSRAGRRATPIRTPRW